MSLLLLFSRGGSPVNAQPVEEPNKFIFWNLYRWYKKKCEEEVSLEEVADNIIELIEEKPKSKLAKQFVAAISKEDRKVDAENAKVFLQYLLKTGAEWQREEKVKAELKRQFDIDEEEAILLLF